jgi:hypothetical protein
MIAAPPRPVLPASTTPEAFFLKFVRPETALSGSFPVEVKQN